MKKPHLKYMIFAALALLAGTALAGYPLIDPASAFGLGALPMMAGNIDLSKIGDMVEKQGDAWKKFQDSYDARFKNLERDFFEIEKKAGRGAVYGLGHAGDFEPGKRKNRLNPEETDHQKAFARYLRKGDTNGLEDFQRKAMNTGSDPDGGFTVIPEMDAVIDRIAETVSPMHRIANVVTIGSAKWEKLVKTTGMAMRRVGDGATGGETTAPKLAKIAIDVFTAEVEPWIHNETLEDSRVNLENDLADEAGIAFAEGGGAEYINGNGVAQARGLLTYPIVANAAYAWGSLGYVVSGATAGFAAASTSVNSADCLITLQHALNTKYRANAVWLMNSTTAGVVRKLKDADGRHIWTDSLINGQPAMLLGHPVEIDDNMPSIGAGAYAIAYGDFKRGYTIANRAGTTLIRDNITSKGITKFNFRRRFSAGITHYEAIKLLKFATS